MGLAYQAYHGERELFDSDHTDKSPVAAIIGRCNIHSVAQYEVGPQRGHNLPTVVAQQRL